MDTNTSPETAATPRFKRGDVVRLNSGGPAMTVSVASEGEDDTAECQWFNGNHDVMLTECFFEDCLTQIIKP